WQPARDGAGPPRPGHRALDAQPGTRVCGRWPDLGRRAHPGSGRILMDVTDLLVKTRDMGASDLHLTVASPPTMRVNGKLTRLKSAALTRDEIHAMLYDLLTEERKAQFEATHDLDFSVELGNVGRFRINAFLGRLGPGVVLRLIASKIKSLDDLGFPPILKDLAVQEQGLVLITGPTGAGKSTTLAAMVDHMNSTREDHVVTVEDPIEFVHDHRTCNINQREVGPHTMSFAAALRAALREDPDVILVGEMRDLETISLALTAAETGPLVLSTLHSGTGAMAIDRIIDVFPDAQQAQVRIQLASVLRAVVTQRLPPAKEPGKRVPAVEVLRASYAIAAQIRERKTHQLATQIQLGQDEGMIPLERSLVDLVRTRRITRETALAAARSPEELQRWLKD